MDSAERRDHREYFIIENFSEYYVGLRGSEGVGWEVKERDVSRGTSLQIGGNSILYIRKFLRGSEGVGWEVKERNVSRGTSLQRRWKFHPLHPEISKGE